MWDLITRETWLVPVTIGLLIPIAGIVSGILRSMQRARLAELEPSLKQEMLQRGMSSDEIVRVLQARSGHDSLSRECKTTGRQRAFASE